MSETKYTPGPWKVKGFGAIVGGKPLKLSRGSALGQIAMATLGDNIEADERDANARLIAAAPELLEALKAAREELRLIRMKDCGTVYDPTLKSRMELAINKAEGR